MAHYRRLTAEQIDALPGGTEYERLAAFGGVRVGEFEGDVIVQTSRADAPYRPGTYLGETIEELPAEIRPHVLHARWEPTNEEDPGYGPESSIPDGAVVIESGINPHTFATE